MSDADDQMGGQGGETGRKPGQPPDDPHATPDKPDAAKDSQAVDEESGQSFPASDPPANY